MNTRNTYFEVSVMDYLLFLRLSLRKTDLKDPIVLSKEINFLFECGHKVQAGRFLQKEKEL